MRTRPSQSMEKNDPFGVQKHLWADVSVLFFSVAGFRVKAGLSRRNSGTTVPRCKRQLSFRDIRIGDARQGQPPPQRHAPHIERGRCWRCSDLAPANLRNRKTHASVPPSS